MDVKQLRSFLTIAELGSINKAAKALHIAQPALSLQIRRLEEELEVQLLRRHPRGVAATDAGRALLAHARTILDELDKARHALQEWRGAPCGRIMLGIPPSINAALGPALFLRCRSQLPDIAMPIHEEMSEVLVEGVISGRLDLGLAYLSRPVPRLIAEPLVQERLFFVSRQPARGQGRKISLREVAAVPLALPSSPYNLRGSVEAAASDHGIDLNISLEVGSISLLKELVLRGDAASILPWNHISREVRSGTLSAAEIVSPAIVRTLYFVHPSDRPPSRAGLALRSIILGVVAESASHGIGGWDHAEADALRQTFIRDNLPLGGDFTPDLAARIPREAGVRS